MLTNVMNRFIYKKLKSIILNYHFGLVVYLKVLYAFHFDIKIYFFIFVGNMNFLK